MPGDPDRATTTRPAALPNGRPWPAIAVFVRVGPDQAACDATLTSLAEQAYPEADAIEVAADGAGLAAAIAATPAAYVIVLRAGDRLVPGALAALALAVSCEAADAAAGLRIVGSGAGTRLDVLSARPGPLRAAAADAALRPEPGGAPFRGGDVLIASAAIRRAGGLAPNSAEPIAEIWPRLARAGIRLARVARPVLVQAEYGSPREVGPRPGALRVAAVNDTGFGGGAGIAHRRLIEALRFGGHAVSVHTLAAESPPVAAEWTDSFPRTEAAIRAQRPDVILAGNLHGATRTGALLGRLAATAPLVAILHDLFVLTGRCAHPGGCTRIAAGCDALCPTPNLYPQLDPARIAGVFRGKRDVLAGPRSPALVANSAWTAQQARALAPAGTRVARLDLAFPTQVFRPGDRAALRRRLGLPPHDRLIVFGAVIADQPDKGGPDLVRALGRVAGPGVGFVALGRIDDPASFRLPNLFAPGLIGDEAELAAWYGACDLHVTASRLETLGQTPIEAGLCGTPTVAYRNTGLTTAVIDGVSGVLTDPDPDALADAVAALLADPARLASLSGWGRIALESRNSHAAAALGLHDVFADLGLVPGADVAGRIRLTAETLGTFADGPDPLPGARGTVTANPRPLVRLARRAKQRLWGRAQPLWMRRGLYGAHLVRRALRRLVGREAA